MAEPLQRHRLREYLVHLLDAPARAIELGEIFLHRCDDRARANGVGADAVLRQVNREGVREGENRALRRRVGADIWRIGRRLDGG